MKNLEERLQKGIQFGKGDNYEAYMSEVEQVINQCIDVIEGKPGPEDVNYIEAKGGKSISGKNIIVIRYDGKIKLIVEYGKAVRVQLDNRNAIVCNEKDTKVLRDFQKALKDNPLTENSEDDDDVPECIKQLAEALEKATGASVKVGNISDLEDTIEQAPKDSNLGKALEDARKEAAIRITMSYLDCPREAAEGIVKSYEDFIKSMD